MVYQQVPARREGIREKRNVDKGSGIRTKVSEKVHHDDESQRVLAAGTNQQARGHS